MDWDRTDPRAVFPSYDLLNSDTPVLGTGGHALSSPLPFGLGVYAVHSKTPKRALPLYYVSEKVAASRGRGVKDGWYVVAQPGTTFELRLTAVQKKFPKVYGKGLQRNIDVAAVILVDGLSVNRGSYFLTKAAAEIAVPGFVDASEYEGGATEGMQVVRKFAFRKAATVVEGAPTVADDKSGSIEVEIYSGRRESCSLQPSSWKGEQLDQKMHVREKDAAKLGKSIKVDRGGAKMKMKIYRGSTYVNKTATHGVISIFLREKFWMESRNLIDADGRPWAPKKGNAVIDLDTANDEDVLEKGPKDKRREISRDTPASVFPRKKAKTEVVDLTKVREFMDLTIVKDEVDLTTD